MQEKEPEKDHKKQDDSSNKEKKNINARTNPTRPPKTIKNTNKTKQKNNSTSKRRQKQQETPILPKEIETKPYKTNKQKKTNTTGQAPKKRKKTNPRTKENATQIHFRDPGENNWKMTSKNRKIN